MYKWVLIINLKEFLKTPPQNKQFHTFLHIFVKNVSCESCRIDNLAKQFVIFTTILIATFFLFSEKKVMFYLSCLKVFISFHKLTLYATLELYILYSLPENQ